MRKLILLIALAGTAPIVSGQAGAPVAAAKPAPSTIYARSTLVLVPALVRTAAGELMTGLQAPNFPVIDNGAEQKVVRND